MHNELAAHHDAELRSLAKDGKITLVDLPRVGAIRIGDAAEYGRTGFVVEQFTYGNCAEPDWCVPGWVEDAWGRSGFFATKAEAAGFLAMIEC